MMAQVKINAAMLVDPGVVDPHTKEHLAVQCHVRQPPLCQLRWGDHWWRVGQSGNSGHRLGGL